MLLANVQPSIIFHIVPKPPKSHFLKSADPLSLNHKKKLKAYLTADLASF